MIPRWLKPRPKKQRRITGVVKDGQILAYLHTTGPATPEDRALYARVHQILTDHYQEAGQ